jgi:hypothetical protein
MPEDMAVSTISAKISPPGAISFKKPQRYNEEIIL